MENISDRNITVIQTICPTNKIVFEFRRIIKEKTVRIINKFFIDLIYIDSSIIVETKSNIKDNVKENILNNIIQ